MFRFASSGDSSGKKDIQSKAVWAVFLSAIIAFMSLGLVDPITCNC